MNFWEVPRSSRSGLDRGFLIDVGPKLARPLSFVACQTSADIVCGGHVCRPVQIQSPRVFAITIIPSLIAKGTGGGIRTFELSICPNDRPSPRPRR
jgi:hypothetical protein